MAWEARLGLKRLKGLRSRYFPGWLNGLGSPFGIETLLLPARQGQMWWLNGLGSPFEGRK